MWLEEFEKEINTLTNNEECFNFNESLRTDYEGGCKSKYLFKLEKRNFQQKIISRLQTANGLITDFKDILEEERLFYLSLNASRDNKYFPCEFINNVN